MEYMNRILTSLGATVVGGVGASVGMDPSALGKAEKQAEDLGKKLAKSIKGKIKYPEQDAIHQQKREYFCQLVKFNKVKFAHEYEWYEQMGWLKK